MGGLRTRLAACLLPFLLHAAEPAQVEVKAALPSGTKATVRLVFRKGLQVEAASLPKNFRTPNAPASGWVLFDDLSPSGKRWSLQALWPEDAWDKATGVRHRVRWPEVESVWLLSALFTGHGQNYDRLEGANPGNPEKLAKGELWRIPQDLLSTDLGGPVKGILERGQPEDELEDEARIAAFRALLTFGKDPQGAFASYRLRKGEALYSSVVMRYTDRVEPKEVNELAVAIAKRSGIDDVRAIQPGALIKIPVELLADPFQPEGTRALQEDREVREEVKRTVRIEAGPKLKGVRIVLDAGHGGVDPGAMANGVWESDYVYDLVMRTRRLLEQDTEALVSCTLRYPAFGFKVRDQIPSLTRTAEILTTPPFSNDGEAPNAVSVHLRWVLANDLFEAFARKKGEIQKTLFLSFHADILHASARGTMVYVPGAAGVPASFAWSKAQVAEMKHGARVNFTPQERLQCEARSRLFAEGFMKQLQKDQLPIHGDRPIRNVIHRSGKSFIPAVISHCTARTRALLEVGNLANEEDAGNLKDPDFRERYAAALVKAIRAYYRK